MNEELKIIGKGFREKREEMHLSLKEVENATSIRQNYLQAIEEGSASQFLSPVYALGFIKQYASFLGMDGEKLVKDNPQAFKSLTTDKQNFDYGIGTLEVRSGQQKSAKKLVNFFWLGVGCIVLLLAWYFAKWVGVF